MTSRRISLRKRPAETAPAPAPEPEAPAGQGKGRPTPKRGSARGPVLPPPRTRREAAARLKEQQAQDRRAGRTTRTPARMLPRDQGPVRALVRDVVDARRSVAVLMLPVAVLYVAAPALSSLTGSTIPLQVATRLFLIAVLLVIVDSIAIVLVVTRAVRGAFPEEKTGRHVGYGLLRSTVFRRLRMPPAQVRPAPLLRR